jgi:hypothetical protein
VSYSETIQALKDFTVAQRRLAAATKSWDDSRYVLHPQPDPNSYASAFICYFIDSDFLGGIAQEFLSAYNAYERLGKPHASDCLYLLYGHPCSCSRGAK